MNGRAARLARRCQPLADAWEASFHAAYPFFSASGSPRSGPECLDARVIVRWAALDCAAAIYGEEVPGLARSLDDLADAIALHIDVQATESFTLGNFPGPDSTAACVYLFKPLLRESVLPSMWNDISGYLAMESRLDTIALLLFSSLFRSRERLYAAREAARERATALLRRWADARGFSMSGAL